MPKLTHTYIRYPQVATHEDVPTPPAGSIALYFSGGKQWLKDDTGAYGAIDGLSGATLADLNDVTSAYPTAGHVLASNGSAYQGRALIASDIPNLSANKITAGTFGSARFANDTIPLYAIQHGTPGKTVQYNVNGVLAEVDPTGGGNALPVPIVGSWVDAVADINSTTGYLEFKLDDRVVDSGSFATEDQSYLTIPQTGYYRIDIAALVFASAGNVQSWSGNYPFLVCRVGGSTVKQITIDLPDNPQNVTGRGSSTFSKICGADQQIQILCGSPAGAVAFVVDLNIQFMGPVS